MKRVFLIAALAGGLAMGAHAIGIGLSGNMLVGSSLEISDMKVAGGIHIWNGVDMGLGIYYSPESQKLEYEEHSYQIGLTADVMFWDIAMINKNFATFTIMGGFGIAARARIYNDRVTDAGDTWIDYYAGIRLPIRLHLDFSHFATYFLELSPAYSVLFDQEGNLQDNAFGGSMITVGIMVWF